MTYIAVRRLRGPAWRPALPMRAQAGWAEHAAFMNGLAAEGFVVLGGPVGSGDREFLLVFAADREDTVRARLDADPWSSSSMLTIGRVERWTILLDGRRR